MRWRHTIKQLGGVLYVIETNFLGDMPHLTAYPLIEERDTGYIVDLRGTKKFMKKKVAGRKYFKEREAAVEAIRGTYLTTLATLRREVKRLEYLAVAEYDFLLDYAEGCEAAADAVEAAIRGSNA